MHRLVQLSDLFRVAPAWMVINTDTHKLRVLHILMSGLGGWVPWFQSERSKYRE